MLSLKRCNVKTFIYIIYGYSSNKFLIQYFENVFKLFIEYLFIALPAPNTGFPLPNQRGVDAGEEAKAKITLFFQNKLLKKCR